MTQQAITIVTPWYGHFAGGAEAAARSFAEQLARRGFQVQVLTTACRSPFESWWQNHLPCRAETVNGVMVRRFAVNRDGQDLYHAMNRRLIDGQPLSEEQQRQFVVNSINSDDLVEYARLKTAGHLLLTLPSTQGLTYSVLAALSGQACLVPCLHAEPQTHWITTYEMFENSRQVFFLTEEEKSLAIREFGRKLGRKLVESPVVGVGVEIAYLPSQSAEAQKHFCRRYRLPDNYFVYLGRKDVGKNIAALVRYFQEFRSAGNQAELLFLGGGDAGLVPKEPGFCDLGFVPPEDKYQILAGSLGLINLSRNESFSIALMESWLCQVPVVVNEECPVTAAHCHKSAGGIAVSTPDDFRKALSYLADPSRRKKLGLAGQHYVRHHYAWDRVIDRLIQGAAG